MVVVAERHYQITGNHVGPTQQIRAGAKRSISGSHRGTRYRLSGAETQSLIQHIYCRPWMIIYYAMTL